MSDTKISPADVYFAALDRLVPDEHRHYSAIALLRDLQAAASEADALSMIQLRDKLRDRWIAMQRLQQPKTDHRRNRLLDQALELEGVSFDDAALWLAKATAVEAANIAFVEAMQALPDESSVPRPARARDILAAHDRALAMAADPDVDAVDNAAASLHQARLRKKKSQKD